MCGASVTRQQHPTVYGSGVSLSLSLSSFRRPRLHPSLALSLADLPPVQPRESSIALTIVHRKAIRLYNPSLYLLYFFFFPQGRSFALDRFCKCEGLTSAYTCGGYRYPWLLTCFYCKTFNEQKCARWLIFFFHSAWK